MCEYSAIGQNINGFSEIAKYSLNLKEMYERLVKMWKPIKYVFQIIL